MQEFEIASLIRLRDFGAEPREAMMIGDTSVDVRTARNAGTWACGVRYGFGTEGMATYPPDLMLDSFEELPANLGDPFKRSAV